MGDRANVRFEELDGGVLHFYTHWEGTELPGTVARALRRGRDRWDDDQYLARIIFCEIVGVRRFHETTGFGISTSIGDGEHRVVTVDVPNQTVTDFDGVERTFEEYVQRHTADPALATRHTEEGDDGR